MAHDAEPPIPEPPPSRIRRWILRGLRAGIFIYLGVTLVLYLLQTRMIFAGCDTQGRPDANVAPRGGVELLDLKTPAGERVAALFGPALDADGRPLPDPRSRPTLLYFYGNAMCLKSSEYDLERLRRLGVNVLIPEYLGYGMSGGQPGEAGCYATAEATYAHLMARPDVDPARLVVGGWSLGGAVAIDLAARRPVAGLMVFSTFSSMSEMASRMFPFLPTSLLLRHRFENAEKITHVACPILIAHGTNDSIVPVAMATTLASRARGPVTSFTIAGADHNDVFEVRTADTFSRIGRWIQDLGR